MLPHLRHTRTRGGGGGGAPPAPPDPTWLPTDFDPASRYYRADTQVTTSGIGEIIRTGVRSKTGPVAYSAYVAGLPGDATDTATDGQQMVELDSGRLLLLGGAPGGRGYESVNTVWCSDDGARTWPVLLPSETSNFTRFKPGHTVFGCVHEVAGVRYFYMMGGDPLIGPNGEVWRTPMAGDGTQWEMMTASAPFVDRILANTWSVGGKVYVGGGQESIYLPATKKTSVYESTTGATWALSSVVMPLATGQVIGPLPIRNGKAILIGGGVYDQNTGGPGDEYHNGVYSFDPATGLWTTILAPGHTQFAPVRYVLTLIEPSGRLWKINGATAANSDNRIADYSDDGGANWTSLDPNLYNWAPTHASAGCSTASRGVFTTAGFQNRHVYALRTHTGARVDRVDDLGSAGYHVGATGTERPVLDLTTFSGKPGIVAAKGQLLQLLTALPGIPDTDVDNTTGTHEAWLILKTLNYASLATLVGNTGGSAWNSFNLGTTGEGDDGGSLHYKAASPSTDTLDNVTSPIINDDEVVAIGFQHTAANGGTIKMFVGDAQVEQRWLDDGGNLVTGMERTGIAYSDLYTGWNAFFAGIGGSNKIEAVLAEAVVRRGTPWGPTEITKFAARVALYGAAGAASPPAPAPAGNAILTETGDRWLTETGDVIVMET